MAGCLVPLRLSFQIKLQDGRVVRRHIDHIIYRSTSQTTQAPDDWMDLPQISNSNTTEQSSTIIETAPPPLRRSTRISVPPKRYAMVKRRLQPRGEGM